MAQAYREQSSAWYAVGSIVRQRRAYLTCREAWNSRRSCGCGCGCGPSIGAAGWMERAGGNGRKVVRSGRSIPCRAAQYGLAMVSDRGQGRMGKSHSGQEARAGGRQEGVAARSLL
jgi:hypothetical protein